MGPARATTPSSFTRCMAQARATTRSYATPSTRIAAALRAAFRGAPAAPLDGVAREEMKTRGRAERAQDGASRSAPPPSPPTRRAASWAQFRSANWVESVAPRVDQLPGSLCAVSSPASRVVRRRRGDCSILNDGSGCNSALDALPPLQVELTLLTLGHPSFAGYSLGMKGGLYFGPNEADFES
jgi:hypothetical protein